ncbi:MAG: class I SAM-dependent methyltransferase [Gammaproteobacteria bacterium]|nr:class I SAM-dependent methyltransferase [Gammaproteobacteria bacterium]
MELKAKNNYVNDQYFRVRFPYDDRRDLVWREVCRYLQNRYIPENSRIVDLGAGYCNFINNVNGRERHAVDVFTELDRFAAEGVSTHIETCTELKFAHDDSFDVAFASNLFEHLTRQELTDTCRALKAKLCDGGKLILLQPNFKYCYRTYFDDYTHIQLFTHLGLADLIEVMGFGIYEVFPRFLPMNMKSTLRLGLPRLDLLTRLYLHSPFKPLAGQMLIVAENRKELPSPN